jgi:hypothetical protein
MLHPKRVYAEGIRQPGDASLDGGEDVITFCVRPLDSTG